MNFKNIKIRSISELTTEDVGKIATLGSLGIGFLWAAGYFIRSIKKVRF